MTRATVALRDRGVDQLRPRFPRLACAARQRARLPEGARTQHPPSDCILHLEGADSWGLGKPPFVRYRHPHAAQLAPSSFANAVPWCTCMVRAGHWGFA